MNKLQKFLFGVKRINAPNMVTPKEKAERLISLMKLRGAYGHIDTLQAAECSIILVDEILWEAMRYDNRNAEFWYAVRNELEFKR